MREAALWMLIVMLLGCARSGISQTDARDASLDSETEGAKTGNGDAGSDAGPTLADPSDAGVAARTDAGKAPNPGNSKQDAGSPACQGSAATCEQGEALGSIDASNSASKITKQGSGSGWFTVDVTDGDVGGTSTIRIGLGVKLVAPAGESYAVQIMGDTSPNGLGRCVAATVTDTDPLAKTAIWGSLGPLPAEPRQLALYVEHLSGPCTGAWTLTVQGAPCPGGFLGSGQDAMGSCP